MDEKDTMKRVRDLVRDAYKTGYNDGYSRGLSKKEMERLDRNAELLAKALCLSAGDSVGVVMPDINGGTAHYKLTLTGYDVEPDIDDVDPVDW